MKQAQRGMATDAQFRSIETAMNSVDFVNLAQVDQGG
jgi:hypothetical protein